VVTLMMSSERKKGDRHMHGEPQPSAQAHVTNDTSILSQLVAQRIIDRVSAGLSLPLSVTDTTARVLASTEPHLIDARLPSAAALLAGAAPGADDAVKLLAHADRTVGVIVLHGAEPESQVLQVARTLAELIIHQLVVLDQLPHRRWARDKFLDDLLHGRLTGPAEVILHQAMILDVDLTLPRRVVLVDLAGLQPPLAPPQASSLRAIDHQRRVAAEQAQLVEQAHAMVATRPNDVCACLGDRWLAILPAITSETEVPAQALIAGLEALLRELAAMWRLETRAGLGGACAGWRDLPRSFRDACFALEVGPAIDGSRRVFTVEALGLAGLVCHSDALVKAELARRLLAPLTREPELLATLAVFLRVNLAPSLAAQELNVHRHTLSYRLDKIAALTRLDPRRFHDAAQLHIAMLLQQVETGTAALPAPRRLLRQQQMG
jgi:carbohydrate diacid regulator